MSDNVRFVETHRQDNARFKDWKISILDNPSGTFSAQTEIVNLVIGEITTFTVNSFACELDESSNDGVYRHVVDASRLIVLHSDDEILGFAAEKSLGVKEIMYLHGVAVSDKAKGFGVGRTLIETLLTCSVKQHLAFTTQSPVMFCVARALLNGKINPTPLKKLVTTELTEIGRRLIKERPGTFEPHEFVVRNLYGDCLYPQIPQSNDQLANNWFSDSLRIDKGVTRDGFLFVGEF